MTQDGERPAPRAIVGGAGVPLDRPEHPNISVSSAADPVPVAVRPRPEFAGPDVVTVLHTLPAQPDDPRPFMTKRHGRTASGGIATDNYDSARMFAVDRRDAPDLDALVGVIEKLNKEPHACVVMGAPRVDADLGGTRRLARDDATTGDRATFVAVPRLWFIGDIDGVEAPVDIDFRANPEDAAHYIRSRLPPAFRDVPCVWQASGSAGIKPGIRLHMGFMLDRPMTPADFKARLKHAEARFDLGPLNPVGCIYTADPLFLDGLKDPMARRLGVLDGRRQRVELDALPPPPPRPSRSTSSARAPVRHVGYTAAALDVECAKVAGTAAGGRHAALNRAAFALGRFIPTGDLTAGAVMTALVGAAGRAGLDDPVPELRRIVAGGLRAGAEEAPAALGPSGIDHLAEIAAAEAGEAGVSEVWHAELMLTRSGAIAGNLANALTALRRHPRLRGVLGYDAFAERVILLRPPPWGAPGEPGEGDMSGPEKRGAP